MLPYLDSLVILVLVLNFVALGVTRVRAIVSSVAAQGVLLGLLALFIHADLAPRRVIMVGFMVVLKGIAIPRLLLHAMREANIVAEIRPVLGSMGSLLLGALGTALALLFAHTLPLADEQKRLLVVPASLATVWTGLVILTTRTTAIVQVLGYLVLENGVFLFGLLLLSAMPLLVESGVLLDLFTGVFVMGIIVHHISREAPGAGPDVSARTAE